MTRSVNRGAPAPPELQALTVLAAAAKAETLQSFVLPMRGLRRPVLFAWLVFLIGGAAVATILAHRLSAAVGALCTGLVVGLVMRLVWRAQLRRARRAEYLNSTSPGPQ